MSLCREESLLTLLIQPSEQKVQSFYVLLTCIGRLQCFRVNREMPCLSGCVLIAAENGYRGNSNYFCSEWCWSSSESSVDPCCQSVNCYYFEYACGCLCVSGPYIKLIIIIIITSCCSYGIATTFTHQCRYNNTYYDVCCILTITLTLRVFLSFKYLHSTMRGEIN